MGRFDEWLDDTRPVTVAPVTGIGDTIGMLMSHGNISPYIMAWLITVLIRLATGQGVVSAMTAAGIISAAILDPATGQLVGVDPALLVLATAAGSNTLTHINDASFWLFKGYFNRRINTKIGRHPHNDVLVYLLFMEVRMKLCLFESTIESFIENHFIF